MADVLKFHTPQTAQLLQMSQQLQAYERISPTEQQALQNAQLHTLLSHAWQYSSFWQSRLQSAGYTTAADGLAAFTRLQHLTRDDLQHSFTDMRARWPNLGAERIISSASSGSTGAPVRVEKDNNSYGLLYAATAWQENQWHQRDPQLKLAVLSMTANEASTGSWGGIYETLGFKGACETRSLLKHSLPDLLTWLQDFQPAYLQCPPSVAAELAQLAIETNVALPLQQILSKSERVSPQQRKLCEAAFSAPIIDRYSCEEAGWLAMQCPHGQLHVCNPTVLIELVDEHGAACPPGVVGQVLVTSLHSYAMPLLRYALGDLAEWGEPCTCGRTLPVLKQVLGRTRHRVRLPDGSSQPMAFIGDDLGRVSCIREFRLLQYQDNILELQLGASRPLTPADNDAIKAVLANNGLGTLTVHIRQLPRIDWPTGRKREEFIQLDVPWRA